MSFFPKLEQEYYELNERYHGLLLWNEQVEKELKHYKDLVEELTADIFNEDLGSAVKTLRQYGIKEEL